MDILIIGGGAAGMLCALTAAENPENTVTLLERQARVGRKLLSTGNGRCNLSNLHAAPEHYHGSAPAFCTAALEAFPPEETLAYFRSLGLLTVAEPDGRVYPLSDHAGSVVDTLRFALTACPNIQLHTGQCAQTVHHDKKSGFTVTTETARYIARALVIACGGAAGGKLGGGMDGYRLLQQLGHKRTALYPVLSPLRTEPTWPRSLKGVKADALARVLDGKRCVASDRGELLFTDTGVSGPLGFALSRAVSTRSGQKLELQLDFLREYSPEEIRRLLRHRAENQSLESRDLLAGCVHSRLGQMLCKYAGVPAGPMSLVTPAMIEAVAAACKNFRLPLTGVQGMDQAQVTAGGMETRDFSPKTMESRLCPGLFAVGEVLDIDGDCGGFNLQWAWSSARAAGRALL